MTCTYAIYDVVLSKASLFKLHTKDDVQRTVWESERRILLTEMTQYGSCDFLLTEAERSGW